MDKEGLNVLQTSATLGEQYNNSLSVAGVRKQYDAERRYNHNRHICLCLIHEAYLYVP